jgi:hypothetical protein
MTLFETKDESLLVHHRFILTFHPKRLLHYQIACPTPRVHASDLRGALPVVGGRSRYCFVDKRRKACGTTAFNYFGGVTPLRARHQSTRQEIRLPVSNILSLLRGVSFCITEGRFFFSSLVAW